jgi:hypothetical protein
MVCQQECDDEQQRQQKKTTVTIIIIIIKSTRLKPMTKIPMQVTQCLAHFSETAFPEQKGNSKLPHYDVLYIYTKLKGLKCILEEKKLR